MNSNNTTIPLDWHDGEADDAQNTRCSHPVASATSAATTPIADVAQHEDYNEMTAIVWCLAAGVVTLVLLFVWASMFPVFAK